MHAIPVALVLALVLLAPVSTAAQSEPPISREPEVTVYVYDYTRIGTGWTPLIISTVEEFNAVRPPTAPLLVYVAGPGDSDCLSLSEDVLELRGIVVCDTSRPEDFPYDPNGPPEGWRGNAQHRDADTTVIALNSSVPEGSICSRRRQTMLSVTR